MNRIVAAFCLLIIFSFIFSGCITHHGTFSVLSNKPVNLSELDIDTADKATGIEGKAVQHNLLIFIPFGNILPTLREAIDDALLKGGGDVITNATVTYNVYCFLPLYMQQGWFVKGDVVKANVNK